MKKSLTMRIFNMLSLLILVACTGPKDNSNKEKSEAVVQAIVYHQEGRFAGWPGAKTEGKAGELHRYYTIISGMRIWSITILDTRVYCNEMTVKWWPSSITPPGKRRDRFTQRSGNHNNPLLCQ
jgi:hypothetical protein